MEWEFFAKRRKISLDTFLKDAPTLEAAVSLFASKGIKQPTGGALEAHYGRQKPTAAPTGPKVQPTPKVAEPTVTAESEQVFLATDEPVLVDDVDDDVSPEEDTSNDEDEESTWGGTGSTFSPSPGRRGKAKRRKQ